MIVEWVKCKCGHWLPEHDKDQKRCLAWRRFPEVIIPRQCGCHKFRRTR